MKRASSLLVFLFLSLMLVGSASAGTDDGKTIFYNVTTDDAWAAGMALGQANTALDHGYQVVVFLNVHGVLLASKAFKSDFLGANDKNLREMLEAAISKGAKVIVCPMCLGKLGLTMDDLVEGVVNGGPDVTLKAMTADDTVVISY